MLQNYFFMVHISHVWEMKTFDINKNELMFLPINFTMHVLAWG